MFDRKLNKKINDWVKERKGIFSFSYKNNKIEIVNFCRLSYFAVKGAFCKVPYFKSWEHQVVSTSYCTDVVTEP